MGVDQGGSHCCSRFQPQSAGGLICQPARTLAHLHLASFELFIHGKKKWMQHSQKFLREIDDYVEAMYHTIREVVEKAGCRPDDVIGIGIDATSSTFLPLMQDGRPLGKTEQFAANPHAQLKLWCGYGWILSAITSPLCTQTSTALAERVP